MKRQTRIAILPRRTLGPMRKPVRLLPVALLAGVLPIGAAADTLDRDARLMTLSLRRHLVASGRTESPGSPASCISDVQVHVLRWSRAKGEWIRVATTTTGVEGGFRVRLPDRTGRYVATVEASDVDPGNGCEAARSNVVRHRHD